ncbi:Arc-like DNA binding domain-containing protein [Pseudomonas simiae]|uniref:Arc family DNA-binding protein n=1 Tax=Pseudomonas simiae TaxID=321846 RepID=UPI0008F0FEAF|nr:Arc-like DNA binding domain-containing protein [Pseudomonas simiae]
MNNTSSRNADKFVVRLPDGMRGRIGEAAQQNHRSMNSEIIQRLEQSLIKGEPAETGEGEEPLQDLLDKLLLRASQISAQILAIRSNQSKQEEPIHG